MHLKIPDKLIDESFGGVQEGIENFTEWGNKDLPSVLEPMEVDDPSEAGMKLPAHFTMFVGLENILILLNLITV